MTKKKAAQAEYEAAAEALRKFCEDHTDLEVFVLDDDYPIRVQFIPNGRSVCSAVRTWTRTARSTI